MLMPQAFACKAGMLQGSPKSLAFRFLLLNFTFPTARSTPPVGGRRALVAPVTACNVRHASAEATTNDCLHPTRSSPAVCPERTLLSRNDTETTKDANRQDAKDGNEHDLRQRKDDKNRGTGESMGIDDARRKV